MRYFLTIIALFACLAASAQTSYLERGALAQNDTFRLRVSFAMVEAASAVLADTSPSSRRNFAYAGRILLEPASEFFITQFVYAVLANPVISGDSSDSDIAFTVNSQFGKLALAWRRDRGELAEGEQ
jgi:hypothetical protein